MNTAHQSTRAGTLAGTPRKPVRPRRPAAPSVTRTYTIWTYDVWGNARHGFEVNDRYKHGTVTIRCAREIFNPGTPQEFWTFQPTNRQLSRAAGFLGVTWDGEPGGHCAGYPELPATIDAAGQSTPGRPAYPAYDYGGRCHAELTRNGRPIGELCEDIAAAVAHDGGIVV